MNKVKENKKKLAKSDKSKVIKASTPAKEKKLNKSNKSISAEDFLLIENEKNLSDLILKEFDKEILVKCEIFIKSFSRIEDVIITTKDFLEYLENIDEDLHKLLIKYAATDSDSAKDSKNDDSEEEEKAPSVKSDDPVRMYLKEMGNVELLSREGEIAIAKRIESGLDKMMNSILECPASLDIIKRWVQEVKNNEINLREIVDFDEYFNEDNDPYSNSSKRKEIQKIINDKKKALVKEKQQLLKDQGLEVEKEKLEETTSEDLENESFSISVIEDFYKPEILKKLDRVLALSENITKIKKKKNLRRRLLKT